MHVYAMTRKRSLYLCSLILLFCCAMLLLCQGLTQASKATISDLRVGAGDDKVRIVADADKEVDYQSFALSSPNRIVIDLSEAQLSKSVPKEIDVDSKYVKRVRVAQFDKNTVRVVVESDVKRNNYDVFGIVGGSSAYRVAMDFGNIDSYGTGSSSSSADNDSSNNSDNTGNNDNDNDNDGYVDNDNSGNDTGSSDVNISSEDKAVLKGKVITLDPGHGGSDSGAIGPTGYMEKQATLAIGLDVANMLKQAGARVFITRRTDVDVAPQPATDVEELQARCDVGNLSKSDIFISIHMDSFTSPAAQGTTGYYYVNGSSASERLATYIKEGVVDKIGTTDRGTKTSNFYVVKNTTMPATLVEVAFISNPDEEAMLKSQDGQKNAAEGIFNGIVRYFKG